MIAGHCIERAVAGGVGTRADAQVEVDYRIPEKAIRIKSKIRQIDLQGVLLMNLDQIITQFNLMN